MRKPIEVKRGFLSATGRTKSEAQAKLDAQIDWALECASGITESRFGLILILSATPNGYAWQIIDPSELAHGKQFYATCHCGQIAYSDALNQMRHAAAQRAWSVFADDEWLIENARLLPASQADLRSWCKWQREQAQEREARARQASLNTAAKLKEAV